MFSVQKLTSLGIWVALLLGVSNARIQGRHTSNDDASKATLRGSASGSSDDMTTTTESSSSHEELWTTKSNAEDESSVSQIRNLPGTITYNMSATAILTWPLEYQYNGTASSMEDMSDVVRMTEIFYRRIIAQQYPLSYQKVACTPTTEVQGNISSIPLIGEIEFSAQVTFRTTTTGIVPTPGEAYATITNFDQDKYLDSFVRMGSPQDLFSAVESVEINTFAPQMPSATPSQAPTLGPTTSSAPSISTMPTTTPSSQPSFRTIDEKDDQIIPVIAVVDGGGPAKEEMTASWEEFRSNWPNRPFCVLRLVGSGDLLIPTNMASDSNVIIWNVDSYDDTNKYDIPQSKWFDTCDIGSSNVSSVALLIQLSEEEVEEVVASKKYIKKLLEGGDSSDSEDDKYTIMVPPRKDGNWIKPFDVRFLATASPTFSPTFTPTLAPTFAPTVEEKE